MQGHARVETIDYIAEDPATKELHARLVDRKGEPRVAKDVFISYLTAGRNGDGTASGRLGPGWAARRALRS